MRKPKTQSDILATLEPKAIRAVDKIRLAGWDEIASFWQDTKMQMKHSILMEYHRDFRYGAWTLAIAKAKGTMLRIERHIHASLSEFQARSQAIAARTFKNVYRQGVLRHAWILDQITPESYDVKIPSNRMMREAGVTVYTGSDADQMWRERWSNWMGAYQGALNGNIRLGAINESKPEDAAGEVDDTKAGTPAYDPEDALYRVFQYQALSDYSNSLRDLAASNEAMGIEEIWQTRYNARVCDDCDSNQGLNADEADGEIPLHPNCECYYRLVPASFAELLRSGSAGERALAQEMDGLDLVPGSMVLRNEAGAPAAKMIVDYEDWVQGMPHVVGAMGN